MDDLGESPASAPDPGGIWEEGVVPPHRGNQTLIPSGGDSWSMVFFSFFFCHMKKKKRFFTAREADGGRLVPAASANPINSINSLETQFKMMQEGCPLPGRRMQISHIIHNWVVSMVETRARAGCLFSVFCW